MELERFVIEHVGVLNRWRWLLMSGKRCVATSGQQYTARKSAKRACERFKAVAGYYKDLSIQVEA
jgi:hypothetical protein